MRSKKRLEKLKNESNLDPFTDYEDDNNNNNKRRNR